MNTVFVTCKRVLRTLLGHKQTIPVAVDFHMAEQKANDISEMIPDYAIANYVGGGGAEQFIVIGQVMIEWFKLYCDLRPDERVLEVGCGIGRVAIPLTQYVKQGTYVGFDIVPEGIEWCQQKVTPKYPNFHFFVADVYNKYYHPEGRQTGSTYRFPFADGSFDFVYLTSVFTHMLPADMANYISEIGRVLRPGGRCFCTAYVIDQEGSSRLEAGTSRMPFKEYPGGYWSINPENPEHAIAYQESLLHEMFRTRGLQINRSIYGKWWETDFAQDILIAVKSE